MKGNFNLEIDPQISIFNSDGDSHPYLSKSLNTLLWQFYFQLCYSYPQYADGWQIEYDNDTCAVILTNLLLSGEMGFCFSLMDKKFQDKPFKFIVDKGGELLERYNAARNKALSLENSMADVRYDTDSWEKAIPFID